MIFRLISRIISTLIYVSSNVSMYVMRVLGKERRALNTTLAPQIVPARHKRQRSAISFDLQSDDVSTDRTREVQQRASVPKGMHHLDTTLFIARFFYDVFNQHF
jgi:hypothetical protein